MTDQTMQPQRASIMNSSGSMGALLGVFVIACAECQRLWPTGTSLIYLAVCIPLLLIWIAHLAGRSLAENNAALVVDISIYVLLVASVGIKFKSNPPGASELASTLLFWAPLVSAWWAWRYRHLPLRLWMLLGGFFVVLTWQLASDHERLDEHLILCILIALLMRYVYRSQQHTAMESSTNLRDPLTGLPSPECFEAELAHVSAISDRYQFPLTLIGYRFSLDDQSPQKNNHLQRLAEAIADRLRTSDTACHWAPGMLMIMLPNTSATMAITVADGILETFQNLDFGQNFRLTTEIKIVQHAHGEDPMSTVSALENKLANNAE